MLAGDVGGTNLRLGLFRGDPESLEPVVVEVVPTRGSANLAALAHSFLERHGAAPSAAAFGVASPVLANRAEGASLPWPVDARELARAFGIERVALLNDLQANAHGLAALQKADLSVLNVGAPDPNGSRVLISAGTGLGMALIHPYNGEFLPVPSEGGHAAFAPRNELEIELLRWLSARQGRVVNEDLVSGRGLVNLYQFLRDTKRGVEPDWLAKRLSSGDAAAVIAQTALEGSCALSSKALDLFVDLYGAIAGDAALSMFATGGVYIGGGIAPKILPRIVERFMAAFTNKGRVSPLVGAMPVSVVLDDRAALLGAALAAAISARRR